MRLKKSSSHPLTEHKNALEMPGLPLPNMSYGDFLRYAITARIHIVDINLEIHQHDFMDGLWNCFCNVQKTPAYHLIF